MRGYHKETYFEPNEVPKTHMKQKVEKKPKKEKHGDGGKQAHWAS